MLRRLAAATLVLAGLVLVAPPGHSVERRATSFKLKDVNGRTYDLKKSLGDKVILINFWATWCAPCASEMDALNDIHKEYEDKGLQILAVSIDDPKSVDQVKPLVRSAKYKFKVLLDTESRVVTMYNPKKVVPFTAIIDKDGNIVHERLGYEPGAEKELEAQLRALLGLDGEDAGKE